MQQIATKNNQLPSPSAPTYAFQIGAGGNNATPIIGEIKEFYLFAGILRSDYQSLLDRNSVITKGSFGVKISS